MKKFVLIVLTLVGIQALASHEPSIENLLGYLPDGSGITFQVKSGGCTYKHDFVAKMSRKDDGVLEVTLLRLRPDPCYPFLPMGERLKFSYSELGFPRSDIFRITNPNGNVQFGVWPDVSLPQ